MKNRRAWVTAGLCLVLIASLAINLWQWFHPRVEIVWKEKMSSNIRALRSLPITTQSTLDETKIKRTLDFNSLKPWEQEIVVEGELIEIGKEGVDQVKAYLLSGKIMDSGLLNTAWNTMAKIEGESIPDPAWFLDWFIERGRTLGIEDANMLDRVGNFLALDWGVRDPEAAVQWLWNREPAWRDHLMDGVFGIWAVHDVTEATSWLSDKSGYPFYDRSAGMLAENNSLTIEEKRKWITSIKDQRVQKEALREAENWEAGQQALRNFKTHQSRSDEVVWEPEE